MLKVIIIITCIYIPCSFADSVSDIFELTDLKSLAKKNVKAEIYRLQVYRSFDSPLVFELEVYDPSSGGQFFTKKARLEERNDRMVVSKILKDSRLKVTGEQVFTFTSLLGNADFWSLPEKDWKETTIIDGKPISESMKDGSTWIFEGISKGKYHRVERRSPTSDMQLWPDEILNKRDIKRVALEGVLLSAWVWMWTYGDESHERIY